MGNVYQSYDNQISNSVDSSGDLETAEIADSWTANESLYIELNYASILLRFEFTGDIAGRSVDGYFTLGEFISSLSNETIEAFNLYLGDDLIESVSFSDGFEAALFFSDDLDQRQSVWSGNDRFIGRSSETDPQDDVIYGYGGNDVFIGGAGSDIFFGGTGLDIAVMAGNRENYVFNWTEALNADTRVNQKALGVVSDYTTKLVDVERVVFDDMEVAFDLEGHAGAVAKTLGAVFGASTVLNKEYAGIGLYYLDNGLSSTDLLNLALEVRLGSDSNNAEAVVDLLYTNLTGSEPDDFTARVYVDLVDSGVHSIASLAQLAADSQLNATNIDLSGIRESGLEYFSLF